MKHKQERIRPFRVAVLSSFFERIRGLSRGCVDEGAAYVVLCPCDDIQTYSMDRAIDVAFADMSGTVVAAYRKVMPGRRIKHAGARVVAERMSCSDEWFQKGDALFAPPGSVRWEEQRRIEALRSRKGGAL